MSDPPKIDATVTTTDPKWPVTIILTAFGIIGTLAGASILLPDQALKVETILAAAISGLFGFIAGRKS